MKFLTTFCLVLCILGTNGVEMDMLSVIPDRPQEALIRSQIHGLYTLLNNNVAEFVRLTFHDAVTFDVSDMSGGSDSCLRFKREMDDPENAGLDSTIGIISTVIRQWSDQGISITDLWQLAGVVAIEHAGGPAIEFRWGRRDCLDDEGVELSRQTSAEPHGDGEVTCTSLEECQCSLHCWDVELEHLVEVFTRLGYENPKRALIALSGAHTLGGVHEHNSGYRTSNWTNDPTVFDNRYFSHLVDHTWPIHQHAPGKHQGFIDDGTQMLISDLTYQFFGCTIATDPEDNLCAMLVEYALDQQLWFDDFSRFYKKMVENGHPALTPPVCGREQFTPTYQMTYALSDDLTSVTFTLTLESSRTFWLGLGFSNDSCQMVGSNAILFTPFNNELNEVSIVGKSLSNTASNFVLEDSQDLREFAFFFGDGKTVVRFTRSLKVQDGFIIDIAKPINFIWAFGPQTTDGQLQNHRVERGCSTITLGTCLNPPTAQPTNQPTPPPPTPPPTRAPTTPPAPPLTRQPTTTPTRAPSAPPTRPLSDETTRPPTQRPTQTPTQRPTASPTQTPTQRPTTPPTATPTAPPTATVTTTARGKTYYEGRGPLNWYEARESCASNGLGHQLATIHTAEENEKAAAVCHGSSDLQISSEQSDCWIGLFDPAQPWRDESRTDSGSLSSWKWVDESLLDFTSFNPGEPNVPLTSDACARFKLNTQSKNWYDWECDYSFRFICETPMTCGGIAGFQCPTGMTCFDDTTDNCDMNGGDADCVGICQPFRGECISHDHCGPDEYCDVFNDCWSPCSDCHEVYDDAIDGVCPPCQEPVTSPALPTRCNSHDSCLPNGYCDTFNDCWEPCEDCSFFMDAFDGGSCPPCLSADEPPVEDDFGWGWTWESNLVGDTSGRIETDVQGVGSRVQNTIPQGDILDNQRFVSDSSDSDSDSDSGSSDSGRSDSGNSDSGSSDSGRSDSKSRKSPKTKHKSSSTSEDDFIPAVHSILNTGPCCTVAMTTPTSSTYFLPRKDSFNQLSFYSTADGTTFIYLVDGVWYLGATLYDTTNFYYTQDHGNHNVLCVDHGSGVWQYKDTRGNLRSEENAHVSCASDWNVGIWYEHDTLEGYCERDVYCMEADESPATPVIIDDTFCPQPKPDVVSQQGPDIECVSPGTCEHICISPRGDLSPFLTSLVEAFSGTYSLVPNLVVAHRDVYYHDNSRRVLAYWPQNLFGYAEYRQNGWVIDTLTDQGVPEYPFDGGLVETYITKARELSGTWSLYDGEGSEASDYVDAGILVTCGACTHW